MAYNYETAEIAEMIIDMIAYHQEHNFTDDEIFDQANSIAEKAREGVDDA